MTGGTAFNTESSRQIPADRPPRSSRRPGSGYSTPQPPGGRGGHSDRCWPAPGVRIDPLFRPLFRGGGGIEVVLRLKIKGGDSQTVQGEGGAETCVIPQMSSGETAKSCMTPKIKFLSPTG